MGTRPLAACASLAIALLAAACAVGEVRDPGSLDQRETTPDEGDASVTAPSPEPQDDAGLPPPPAFDAGSDAASAAPADAAIDTGPVTCTKTITIPQLHLSNSVCTDINTKVTKSPATLTYPCAGGTGTATFGAQTFTGTVSATGQIDIKNVQTFTLTSCQLESDQDISGTISNAQLAYTYGERFVGGDCSGYIICKATGNAYVQ